MAIVQRTALVLGATGQQGGATARHLLADGWQVRALVRDQQKPGAQTLQQLGIELVTGDLDTPASVLSAMQGVQSVFSVQAILGDPAQEVRQGKTVADAAKTAGIAHLVYSSACGVDGDIGIAAFEAKGEIERYLRFLDLPVTVLRPVMFMDNFRFQARVVNGFIQIPPLGDLETIVQLIAVHDIGAFAALALNHPQTYTGKVLDIAGDVMTFAQLAEVFQQVYGRPVIYQADTPEQDRDLAGARKASEFFAREGYKADIPALRQVYPPLLSFAAWLRQADLSL